MPIRRHQALQVGTFASVAGEMGGKESYDGDDLRRDVGDVLGEYFDAQFRRVLVEVDLSHRDRLGEDARERFRDDLCRNGAVGLTAGGAGGRRRVGKSLGKGHRTERCNGEAVHRERGLASCSGIPFINSKESV